MGQSFQSLVWFARIRSRQKRQYRLTPLIPVEGIRVLLPELIYEKGRAEQYLALKQHFDADIQVIVYDLIPLYHPELAEVSREFLHFLRVVRESTQAIAISEYTADQLNTYLQGWAREEKVKIPVVRSIYLPYSTKRELTKIDQFETPTFLFVSTIEPRKNHLRLIAAADRLKKLGYKFRLVCVGKIGWVDTKEWMAIQALKQSGAPVEFMHSVSDAQLKELLQKSWCAIYPSLVEGFGLPIIEADQYGLPVIASGNSAMRDVCVKFVKCYYFVDPRSEESIFTAMKSFMDSSTLGFVENKNIEMLPQSWDEYSKLVYELIQG